LKSLYYDARSEKHQIKCVVLFSPEYFSETFLIQPRNERDMIKKHFICIHVKCPLFLSDYNET